MEGQYELDLRLDYERDLKTNLTQVIHFAGERRKHDLEENGRPLRRVESTQEGYGIAAQAFVKVTGKHKILKGQMDDFLKLLDAGDGAASIAGQIYNACLELSTESTLMAAEAERILKDLYYTTPRTPLEEFQDAEAEDYDGEEDQE